jgi:TPP-dependent pyruvate/acetoin dehydrogenase alpha subunit
MMSFEELEDVNELSLAPSDLIAFEKSIAEKYESGTIKGPIHLSDGNEEELIRVFAKVDRRDWVFSTWRSHYHALLHGVDPFWLEAEIVEGRSMGIISQKPFIYCSSIFAGSVPAALGAAYAFKLDKSSRRAWLFVGDMALRSGIVLEAYQYALNFELPLQIVCEDNGKSVVTDTNQCWGGQSWDLSKIHKYSYQSKYPHHGTGNWVNF